MNVGNTSQEIPGQARHEGRAPKPLIAARRALIAGLTRDPNPLIAGPSILIAGLTRDLQALRAGLVLTNNILQKIDEIG